MRFAFLSLLLLASPLWADVKVKGELKVRQYGYAELSLEGAKPALWSVLPNPVQITKDTNKVLRFGGVPGASYEVTAIYGTVDKVTSEIDFQAVTVTVTFDGTPAPPVPPIPPAPPTPPTPPTPPVPPPVPVPTGDFRVVFLVEKQDALTREQLLTLFSTKARAYLNAKAVPAKDGAASPGWRQWDKDTDISRESATWQAIFTAVKGTAGPTPKIVLFKGTAGEAFPLPETEEALMALLQKFGG